MTEQQAREQALVERVVASFDGAADPRLKQPMQALTRHLHAFLREVRLTEAEWNTAIEFLTAAGHLSDAKRQEFILLSDVLGASMQTIAINNEAYENATEATVFGPFFVEGSPEMRASHLHFKVAAAGRRTLVTHIFVHGDAQLADDAVFGVKDSLIKEFVEHPPGTPTPDGRDLADRAWASVRFDIVLAPI